LIACSLTLYRPSLLPPGLHSRDLEVAAASTQVLVTTANLAVGGPADYLSLVNRGILVGNLMVSGPVLADIGHELGVPPSRIEGTAPMTADVPRTLIEPGSGGNVANLLASPDHYKLEIQADPSVPILHVYGQAPTKQSASRLVSAAVHGISRYLQQTESLSRTPPAQRLRVEQLGPVQGGVANSAAPTEIAVLVFSGVFGVSLWLIVIFTQIHRGWLAARLEHQLQL
jgi:hypothetical protein